MSLPRTVKICVLGAARQGKSALILRFISDTFLRDYDPTIEDTFTQVIAVEDEEIELRILDTAGSDEFSSLQDTWIAEGELFVLVFGVDSQKEGSLDEPSPYQELGRYAHKIKEIKSKVCKDHVSTPPMVIVGTKHNDPEVEIQEWTQECKNIEHDFGCSYLQCSARTNSKDEILTLWQQIVGVYLRHLEQNRPDDEDDDGLNSDDGGNCKCFSCCRVGGGPGSPRPRRHKYSLASSKTYGAENGPDVARTPTENRMRESIDFTNQQQDKPPIKLTLQGRVSTHSEAEAKGRHKASITEFGGLSGVELAVTVLMTPSVDDTKNVDFEHEDEDAKRSESDELSFSPQPNQDVVAGHQTYQTAIRFEYAPKRRIKRFEANKYLTLYEVHRVPKDVVFPPILTHKNWRVRRAFHWLRFLLALICGVFLPVVLIVQSLTFLFYSERSAMFCWYTNSLEFDNIHHSILLDFLGIVVGRKANQDPEIKKDDKWFARQSWHQKIARFALTFCVCGVYFVCANNLYVLHAWTSTHELRVSLMETFGPICLLAVLWILLSLWIAYDSNIKPKPPPLSKLKKAELYFGETYNRKTTAYKFIRGYMSSATGWKLSWWNVFLLLSLGVFYASIPGLTRVTVGDASDGLDKKRFMTRRELPVELGAFLVNAFLIIALMYTVEIQYSKYMEILRDWVYEVSAFLAQSERVPPEEIHGFDELELQRRASHSDEQNAPALDDMSMSTLHGSKTYFDEGAFVSLRRAQNVAAWLEIRTFLACESRLFFGEQELPILWVLAISGGLNIFILYRVFLVQGKALESVLFNGMIVLQLICMCALLRIKNAAWHFELLQIRQETLIEVQTWMMQCQNINDGDDDDAGILDMQSHIEFVRQMMASVVRQNISPQFYRRRLSTVLTVSVTSTAVVLLAVIIKAVVDVLVAYTL